MIASSWPRSVSEVQRQTSGCILRGKPYEQLLEEATAENLLQRAEKSETAREPHLKRQAFIAGLQSSVIAFFPRGVSQVAARDRKIYSISNGNTN